MQKWSDVQRKRLAEERLILQKFFPKFQWVSPWGETKLEGTMQTNSGTSYTIRVYLPSDYPNSIPSVVILSPSLKDYKGRDLVAQGMSTLMHTLDNMDGYLAICHYRPEKWHPQITLYKILVKVRLWLEAFHACAWVVLPGVSPMRRIVDKSLNLRGPKRGSQVAWHVEPQTTLTALTAPKASLPSETWLTTATGKHCFQALYTTIRQTCGEVRLFQQSDHDIAVLCRYGDQYLELTFPPDFPSAPYRVALAMEVDANGRLVQPESLTPDDAEERPLLNQLDTIIEQYYPASTPHEEQP